MKLLSTNPNITKFVDFHIFNYPDYSTIQEFKINQYPFLCIYYYDADTWKTIPINPDILYSSLESMLNNILYHKQNKAKRQPFHSNIVKQIYENNQLKQHCSSSDYCVLVFLDGSESEENMSHFNEFIEKMEILSTQDKYRSWNFGWVNQTCQNELADKFKIKSQGGVIVYQQWKEVFSTFTFPTDDLHLISFFEKLLDNKFVANKLSPEDLNFVDKDCLNTIKKNIDEKIAEEKKDKEEYNKERKNFDPQMKTDL